MKNKNPISFLIAFLLLSATCFSQTYPISNRANSSFTVQDARFSAQYNLFVPRYTDTVQANLATNIGNDSCSAVIYLYSTNTLWYRSCAGGAKAWVDIGLVLTASQGITKVGSDFQFGGFLPANSTLHIPSALILNSPVSRIIMENRSADSSFYGTAGISNIQGSVYAQPALRSARLYKEEYNDTLQLQYGGNLYTITRSVFDSTSTRFAAGNKTVSLPVQGIYSVGQILFPRDSVDWNAGRDGNNSTVFQGDLDLGDSYGYNVNIVSEVPKFPISVYRSNVDLIRVVDNNRRKKMTGEIAGFVADWKGHQQTISSGTFEVGNHWSKITDFVSFGSLTPTIGSSVTKDKILAVARVDSAFSFVAHAKRLTTNEVVNGYGFVALGDSDYNYFAGKAKFGGTIPGHGGQTETVNVTGSLKADSTSLRHLITEKGIRVNSDHTVSFGEFKAEVGGFIKDTTKRQFVLGSYLPASIADRVVYTSVGDSYTSGDYPLDGTGFRYEIRTGGGTSAGSTTTQWRNGNVSMGGTTYRLTHKLSVIGKGIFTDTLYAIKPTALSDSSDIVATTKWVKQQAYGSGGGGSGDVVGPASATDGVPALFDGTTGKLIKNSTPTGTGNPVMQTTPTFTTSITTPSIIGGTSTTQTLTYKTTTGVGATGADHIFQVGNNGATEAVRILNSGSVGIGVAAPNSKLSVNGRASFYKGTEFSYADPTSTDFIVSNSAANSRFLFGQTISSYGGLNWIYNATAANAYMTVKMVNTDVMAFLQNGNVGIATTAPTSILDVRGSLATQYTATATSLTAGITHSTINVTATGQTITLPTAVGISGRIYTIKLTASGSGTVATTSSQTIDGSTTYSLSAQYKFVTVQSDNANWIIIGNN